MYDNILENFRKYKVIYSDTAAQSGCPEMDRGTEQQDGVIIKGHGIIFEGEGYIQYLHCGGGFTSE